MLPPPFVHFNHLGWLLYINTVLRSQNSYKTGVLISLISSYFRGILGGSRSFQGGGGGWLELWSA